MEKIAFIILGITITGIVLLLCLCCCYMASKSDAYWEEVKKGMEENDRQ